MTLLIVKVDENTVKLTSISNKCMLAPKYGCLSIKKTMLSTLSCQISK